MYVPTSLRNPFLTISCAPALSSTNKSLELTIVVGDEIVAIFRSNRSILDYELDSVSETSPRLFMGSGIVGEGTATYGSLRWLVRLTQSERTTNFASLYKGGRGKMGMLDVS